jgi:hypothetical protein
MSGKQLLLLQYPPSWHTYLPERASLVLEDPKRQHLNVDFLHYVRFNSSARRSHSLAPQESVQEEQNEM